MAVPDCSEICIRGMRTVSRRKAGAMLDLLGKDLAPPFYTDGVTVYIPCPTCNPDWQIPVMWERLTWAEVKEYADG